MSRLDRFNWARGALLAMTALGVSGCGAAPLHASSDWERGADLQPGKTFYVARSPFLPKNLTAEQTALLEVAEKTAKKQLSEKGYHEATLGEARLVATTYFIKHPRDNVVSVSTTCGINHVQVSGSGFIAPGLTGACEESYISKYDEGTLLIDLYDTQLDELVWHGWASTEWPEKGSHLTPELVERATIDILARFPP